MKTLPKATAALIAANIAMFLLQMLWGGGNPIAPLDAMGAMRGDAVFAGEWWRLLSSAFLHVAIWHVAANCYVLYLLGSFLELILGSARFLALYAVSALGGGLAELAFSPAGSSVGASGAVWGLLVVYLVLAYRPGEALNQEFALRMRRTAWINLLLNVAISFVPGVSMSGHFGGGIAGGLLALSSLLTRGISRERDNHADGGVPVVRSSAGWKMLANLAVLLMAGCVAVAILHGGPWKTADGPELTEHRLPDSGIRALLPSLPRLEKSASGSSAYRVYFSRKSEEEPFAVNISIFRDSVPPQWDFTSDKALLALRKMLETEQPEEGGHRIGAITPVGFGRAALQQEIVFEREHVRRIRIDLLCRDQHAALVVDYSPDLPAAWSEAAVKVAGSLRCPEDPGP